MSIRGIFKFLIGGIFLMFAFALYDNRVIHTTVLIQEGHVGRVVGNIGSSYKGLSERDWNKKVGKVIERTLKKKGIEVERIGARIPVANARIAVAIHFDGSEAHCATGASIGHNGTRSSKAMADRWRKDYGEYFPFKWHKHNFTKNLSDYYGFRRVNTSKGFLVLELGELTCIEQTDWLEPRLEAVGVRIANFIIKELKR